MNKGWTYLPLGDICDVINGLWTGKKEPFVNIAVIRNTNFSKDCRLKLDDVAFIDVEAKQFSKRKALRRNHRTADQIPEGLSVSEMR